MKPSTRREFIQQTSQTAAAAAALSAAQAASAAPKTDRLVVAVIGPGGMGSQHVRQLATNSRVKLAYVCDVDQRRAADAVKLAKDLSGGAPKPVGDLRQVLDDRSVDAVWIATPDHWHAPAAILACEAGKHVYVEKPCAHNIREGRLMIDAARRNNRVLQVGTQSRSTAHVMKAIQRLEEGAIGEVLVTKAWNSQNRRSIGHVRPSEPPAYLDYDLWVGPAVKNPYRTNVVHSNWRWWRDYGCGDMGNDGIHEVDLARWALGVKTHPSRVAAMGGKYQFDDDQQFPDTQYVAFEYAPEKAGGRKRQLIYEQRLWSPYVQEGYENGIACYGTEGMLLLAKHGGYKLFGRHNKLKESLENGEPDVAAHHRNFIECIETGARPHADIEINHLSSALCHLGNIATRLGRVLHFDPQHEKIVGDDEANRLVRREYRDGHWAVPKGV